MVKTKTTLSSQPQVLIIDNYDSFTYNLYQYFLKLKAQVTVFKNNELTLPQLKKLPFTHLVLSPGPGNPENSQDFGISMQAIHYCLTNRTRTIPILGVCLGHQGLALYFKGKVTPAPEIKHGVRSQITITSPNSRLFQGLPTSFQVMRYHSLIVDTETLPKNLQITAKTQNSNLIMAFEDPKKQVYGVQFHPESIGTSTGLKILNNFLNCNS